MPIFSCKDCVPPKRHPGCHGYCSIYLDEKAKYEQEKEEIKKRKAIEDGLNAQRAISAYRAVKICRKKG